MSAFLTAMREQALRILILALIGFGLGGVCSVDAQYCMQSDGYPKLIFDSSNQGCMARPTIPRAYYPNIFKFHQTNYLGLSDGNQLKVYGLTDPAHVNLLSTSNFPVTHFGDSDYDLQARVMCDECRYAFFPYQAQAVFADLLDPATNVVPSFLNYVRDLSIQYLNGGFTFKSGSTQYLITNKLASQCQGAALFRFNSTDPATIANNFISCLQDDSGAKVDVSGGLYLQDPAYNDGTPYLWLSNGTYVYAFRVSGSEAYVSLQYERKLDQLYSPVARGSHTLGVAVDLDQEMAVSISNNGLAFWDFPNHDLSNPRRVLLRPDIIGNLVSFHYPLLWTTSFADGSSTTNTFRVIGDASNPSLEDIANPPGSNISFWDSSQSWNDTTCDSADLGAAFSPDGGNLYVARWEIAQNYDFSGCAGPQIPTAHVKVERWNGNFWVTLSGSPFPGDQIRVSSTSSGEISSTVITLKDASGAVIDTSSGSATATPLEYTIPVGGGAAEPSAYYTASVEASNAEGPDTDQSTVTVDLSPQGFPAWVVTDTSGTPYSGSPQSATVNDKLTLSATAEGTPGVPVGLDLTDPYQWLVTAPDQTTTYTASGAEPVDQIALDEAGTWMIQVTVFYQHLDEGGTGTYTYTTTPPEELTVSSVAASMIVATQNPVNTADLVLDGTESRWATGGVDPSWKWEYKLHAATSWSELTSCADQSTCTIPGSEQSQTLDPGTYDFRLTLSLGQDSSQAEVSGVVVANGLVDYDITVSNAYPDKGESITYHLTNISDVDQVTWNFYESGCDLSSTVTCTPGFGATCLSQVFSYPTSGSKTVSATVTVNGQSYPLTKNNIVTVSTSGSCSGTTCSYTVSPTSAGLPYTSSTKTFTVSTTSSCSWNAYESASWLSITSGSSGTGSGSVVISADENTGNARSTTMTIAGKSITVSQDASPCNYTVSPEERDVPVAGNTGYTIWVGATSGCSWTATSSANWVRIQSGTASGTGNGQVKYDVYENELGSTRSATITIGGARHTINQDAAVVIPVDFSFSPNSVDIGQAVRFQVTDNRVTPIRWEFGGPSCDGSTTMDCQFSPDLCRDVTWEYAASGWYSVRLVAQEGEKTHGGLHVLNEGECCYKDGKPTADFTVSPNPVFTGETVSFTDGSSKAMDIDGAGKTTGLGFSWTPVQPEIGQIFSLTITGVGGVDSAAWDFGEAGCDFDRTAYCEPGFGATCMDQYFAFASAGEKTVKLTINGNQSVTQPVTVLDQGSCDSGGGGGGGGTTCTYQLSPSSRNFDDNGGTGTVSVSTQDGCSWTASETASWLGLASNSGTGSGSFSYTVASNSGGSRTAKIDVEGQKHTVTQDAHYEPQDTEPTAWHWTVSLDGETVVESDQPDFTASFRHPGTYLVRLDVSNCAGTDSKTDFLQVDQAPVVIPDAYVVPSAVHGPGLNETLWRTDFRVFNPDDHPVVIIIEYLPENTDNSTTINHQILVTIPPHGTRAADDILQLIPGVIGNDDGSGSFSGSLSVTYENEGEEAVPPMIMSRTYNETPNGTFGQFVPAVPAIASGGGELFLSGLVSNIYYRTNVRMANFGDDPAIVQLQLVDKNGHDIGQPIYPEVLPKSTRQINGIAAAAQVTNSLDIFSVRASSENEDTRVWVSVVDNSTGDPVLYAPMIPDEDSDKLWVPGVAHLPGANDSQWRSDLVFFNSGAGTVNAHIDYIASEDLGIQLFLQINGLGEGMSLYYVDMLGNSLLPYGVDSKGYLVIKAEAGSSLPAVAGKTYNVDPDGGTFGQNLFAFQKKDLIEENEVCYLPGITTSPTATTGFRTNLGILNTTQDAWTSVSLRALGAQGEALSEISEMWLAPGQFLQFNLADRLNLHDVEHLLTVEMTVLSGGPVGAYASEVDNRTQDPILIRALKVLRK